MVMDMVIPTPLLILLLVTFAAVSGCGVMPQGQAVTRNFTVTGFRLPTAMVFSTSSAFAQLPGGVPTTSDGAKSFVFRLVMQKITDVLEQQGRRADLPDAIISGILNQVMVQISYEPLECKTITVNPALDMVGNGMMDLPHCLVFGNTVTALCTNKDQSMCKINMNMDIGTIDAKHMSISGSITTTNIIMANWSREMWQSVVNRAVRLLSSGPFASQFLSAVGNVA